MRSFFFILFLSNFGFAQTTYKSLASEYLYKIDSLSTFEWIDRDIIIGKETIVIKSFGKQATDIQTWNIQSNNKNLDTHSVNITYYVELGSGEKYEYPAIITLQFNQNNKVETITCEIPPNKHPNLLDDAPIKTRFLID